MIELESEKVMSSYQVGRIKVIGIGGAGSNMVNNMIDVGYENIEFIAANTDAQSLKTSKAPVHIQLGSKSTKGLGAGANPEIGRRAAEEDIEKITNCLRETEVVFLVGGLGGGTCSGALPVIVNALKDKDILTIVVVTKPFHFEGKRRMKVANDALDLLKADADTLIVIPNQNLLDIADSKISLLAAFDMINCTLNQFVNSISDIVSKPGHVNVDFADVKTIMKQKGFSLIGTGRACGENRAVEATRQAINSPMLDNIEIAGARGVLLNITGSASLGLHELSAAASIIYEQAHEDATIIIGSVIDESFGNDVNVTIIATGFPNQSIECQTAAIKMAEAKVCAASPAVVVEAEAPVSIEVAPEAQPQPMQVEDEKLVAKESVVEAVRNSIAVMEEKKEFDLNNIDIPAIMRRMAQQQKHS